MFHVCLEGVESMEPKRELRLVKCVMDSFIPDEEYAKYEQYITSEDLQVVISNTLRQVFAMWRGMISRSVLPSHTLRR